MWHVSKILSENAEKCLHTLVLALIISKLDYCNSVLYGLPASTLQPLTTVLHCAVKLIKKLILYVIMTPHLSGSTKHIHSFIHSFRPFL